MTLLLLQISAASSLIGPIWSGGTIYEGRSSSRIAPVDVSISIALCLFQNFASSDQGGAMFYSVSSGSASISKCGFINCSSSYSGTTSGGVYMCCSNIIMAFCCGIKCSSSSYQYIFGQPSSQGLINDSASFDCSNQKNNGICGSQLYGSDLQLWVRSNFSCSSGIAWGTAFYFYITTNCFAQYDTAFNNSGGSMFEFYDNGQLTSQGTMSNCQFTFNKNNSNGLIRLNFAAYINNCIFFGNEGTIFFRGFSTSNTISNCFIQSNASIPAGIIATNCVYGSSTSTLYLAKVIVGNEGGITGCYWDNTIDFTSNDGIWFTHAIAIMLGCFLFSISE